VVGSASGTLALEDGFSAWTVMGLIIFSGVALFCMWCLWLYRPSRT
jgi:hypothetical protein